MQTIGKEKAKVVSLEDDVKRLKGEVSHYVAQLNSQKDRLQSKHTDEDQFRNQLKVRHMCQKRVDQVISYSHAPR